MDELKNLTREILFVCNNCKSKTGVTYKIEDALGKELKIKCPECNCQTGLKICLSVKPISHNKFVIESWLKTLKTLKQKIFSCFKLK